MRRTLGRVRYSLMLFLAASALRCVEADAQSLVHFDLPAQSLAQSLKEIGTATNTDVGFIANQVAGLLAPPLKATLTVDGALTRVLVGTGLRPKHLDNHTIVIAAADAYTKGSAETKSSPTQGAASSEQSVDFLHLANLPDSKSPLMLAQTNADAPPKSTNSVDGGKRNEDHDLDEIVVTGTNIKGAVITGPVVEITRHDIEIGGFSSIGQAIASSPMNFGGGINIETGRNAANSTDNANSNSGYASSANLRGLGSNATLVLLDGHRLTDKGDGISVDLSLIPLSIVDHIEVLADGASAIYGSDAIAGVINIITRHDFEGMESRVHYAGVPDGKPTFQADQLFGKTWSGGNLEAGYQRDDIGQLNAESRSATIDAGNPNFIVPDEKQNSVFLDATQDILNGWQSFAEGIYSARDTHNIYDPTPAGFRTPGEFLTEITRSTGGTAVIGIRNEDIGGWRIEAFGTYGHAYTFSQIIANGALADSGLASGIATGTQSSSLGELRASRDLFSLPAGKVKAAAGVSYRSDGANNTADFSSGENTVFPFSRRVSSVYGELSLPLVGAAQSWAWIKDATLSLAGRHEHYSDFGGTFNPRFGVALKSANNLVLRGTYSTSFRAPNNLEETGLSQAVILPAADTASPAGSSIELYRAGSNPSLKPETAKSFTVSAEWRPESLRSATISLDYYNIKYKNRIVTPDPNLEGAFGAGLQAQTIQGLITRSPTSDQVLTALSSANQVLNFTGNPLLDPGSSFNPALVAAIVDGRSQNFAEVKTDGMDLATSYDWDSSVGRWHPSIQLSYILSLDQQLAPTAASMALLNTIYNPVGLRGRVGLDWGQGNWSAAAFVNYVNSYKDNRLIGATIPISSWTTADCHLGYSFKDPWSVIGVGRTTVALNVTNLFYRHPPFVAANGYGYNYDATNSSAIGRVISLDVAKRW
jgi:iron complex outermembrane recepter protein